MSFSSVFLISSAVFLFILFVLTYESKEMKAKRLKKINEFTQARKSDLDTTKTATYNTPINSSTIKENIDSVCRWEQQGDKYHYVVISEKLQGKYLEISSNHWVNLNEVLVKEGMVVANIRIQPFSEKFMYAESEVLSPVEGVSFFNRQSEYRTRDVIVTVDTEATLVEKYKISPLKLEKGNAEEAERDPQLYRWSVNDDRLVLIAERSIRDKYGDATVYFEMNPNIRSDNTLVANVDIVGNLTIKNSGIGNISADIVVNFDDKYLLETHNNSISAMVGIPSSKLPQVLAYFDLGQAPSDADIADWRTAQSMEKQASIARRKAAIEQRERDEIAAKINERHRIRQLEKEVERELIDSGEILKGVHRPTIPQDVKDAVYRRDGGRCVICGSVDDLQYDHDIPFSKGGATNVENLQILCQKCNLKKSNKIG